MLEPVEVNKVDNNIVEVGEVEVISDLELVEVFALYCMFTEYRTISYSG